jgi:hypothetical protein
VTAPTGFQLPPSLTALVDGIAKFGAALGLLALGSAFLHDLIFWSYIDMRMLFYYGIADHIETAVAAVGTALSLLLATSALFGVGFIYGRRILAQGKSPLRTLLWGALASFVWSAVIAAVIAASIRLIGPFRFGSIALAIGMLGFFFTTYAGYIVGSWRSPARPLTFRAAVGISAAFWLYCVLLLALFRAEFNPAHYTDLVTTQGFKTTAGRILRILDRGILLRGADGRVVFIPKDQIIRVDQRVPLPQG